MSLLVACPNCGYSSEYPINTFSVKVRLPEDEDNFLLYLKGSLNLVTCPICSHQSIVNLPLIFYCTPEKEVLRYIMPGSEEIIEEATEEISSAHGDDLLVYSTQEHYQFYLRVLQLLVKFTRPQAQLLNGVFQQPSSLDTISNSAYIRLMSPFFLRVLRLGLDLPVLSLIKDKVTGKTDEEKSIRLYCVLLGLKINYLINAAAHEGKMPTLMEIFQQEIPRECITTALLTYQAAPEQSPVYLYPREDGPKFVHSWKKQYANAVLHACAGQPNPHVRTWAMQFLIIELSTPNAGFQFEQAFHLPNEIIQATIPFKVLWDLMVPAMNDKEHPGTADNFRRLLNDKGYSRQYEALNNEGIYQFSYASSSGEEQRMEAVERSTDQFCDILVSKIETPEESPHEHAFTIGYAAGSIIRSLLISGYEDAAMMIIDKLFTRLEQQPAVLAVIVTRSVEQLNHFLLYDKASRLLERFEDLEEDWNTLPPAILYQLLNECGNTLRYHHDHTRSLHFYDACEKVLDPIRDQHPADYQVLLRNKAIIFRNLGKFTLALEYFDRVREAFSENPEFQNNLAATYLELNLIEEALSSITRAIKLSESIPESRTPLSYYLTRSLVYCRRKEYEKGLADLRFILSHRNTSPDFRPRAAMTLLMRFPPSADPLFQQAVSILEEQKGSPDDNITAASYFSLIQYYLNDHDPDKADELFREWTERTGSEAFSSFNWESYHIKAMLKFSKGQYDECWMTFMEGMDLIRDQLLLDDKKTFVGSYQFDKDRFKKDLAMVGITLYRLGRLPAGALLDVYEFNNGLEITLRLPHQRQIVPSVDGLFFLDHGDEVALLGTRPDGKIFIIEELTFRQEAILQAKNTFHQEIKSANPADLEVLDDNLTNVFKMLEPLYDVIDRYFPGDTDLCFFPGGSCSNLPLHLVRSGDGEHLIRRRCLSYCPNMHIFQSQTAERPPMDGDLSLVIVPKDGDSALFRQRLEDIQHLFHGNTEHVRIFKGADASLEHLLPAIAQTRELLLLCHGADAGVEFGNAICVNDGRFSPPTFLPILSNPSLKRFLLTWKDINKLPATPDALVSIACSSGQVTLREAGVRLGLEQAFLSLGTRTIISPLWDIQQSAALEFIRLFYSLRQQDPDRPLLQQYHTALLQLQTEPAFDHYYFWGSMTYNGRSSKN